MPFVSVVIPTHNRASFLEEAASSVLEQTFDDLELIIVDDASTDGTANILDRLADQDRRVRIIRRETSSGGPAVPRNEGIGMATGEMISFLDDDDRWHPERVALTLEGLMRNKHWIAAFHDIREVDAAGEPIGDRSYLGGEFLSLAASHLAQVDGAWYDCGKRFFAFQLLRYGAVWTGSVMIARNRVTGTKVEFDPRYVLAQDIDLWIRLAASGPFGYLDRVLADYRQHSGNSVLRKLRQLRYASAVIVERLMDLADQLDETEKCGVGNRIARMHKEMAYLAYKEGDSRSARQALRAFLGWGGSRREFAVRYAKSLIPLSLRRILRGG